MFKKETQRTMGMKQQTELENSERKTNKTTKDSRRKHKKALKSTNRFFELNGGYFKTKVKVTAAGRLPCRVFTQFQVVGPALGLGHQKLEEPASWVPFCDGAPQ